jgi:dihydrofolate reductase
MAGIPAGAGPLTFTPTTPMRRLTVFNNVSLDGYFVDAKGGMDFAYKNTADPEWDDFVSRNAGGGGVLLFGRVTYEMMARFWPTAQAKASMPAVAEGMNRRTKLVASRTLADASWSNTTVLKGDLVQSIRKLKETAGPDIVILGSGSIVAQLAPAGLIDRYQLVVKPVVLGGGRTMFEGIPAPLELKPIETRTFANGSVLLCYEA